MKRARLCINNHSKCIQDPKLTLGIGKACRGRVLLGWLAGLVSFFAGQWIKEIIPGGTILPPKQGCCVSYGSVFRPGFKKYNCLKLDSQIQ